MNPRAIISVWAIAALCCAPSAFADNTNIIPSLTVDGETYKNVTVDTVTASYITFLYEDGGGRVALSNLPPALQERFHYDPKNARKADAAEARQKAAANLSVAVEAQAIARAKSTLGPAQRVRIINVITESHLQITTTNGVITDAYIHNLPNEVITFVRDLHATRDRRHLEELRRWDFNGARTTVIACPTDFLYSRDPLIRQWEFQGMPADGLAPR